MASGDPPSGQPSRRRQVARASSFMTDDTRQLAARCLELVQGPGTRVELWEILTIFRNDERNVDIVRELTDEGICGFISAELSQLPHRRLF